MARAAWHAESDQDCEDLKSVLDVEDGFHNQIRPHCKFQFAHDRDVSWWNGSIQPLPSNRYGGGAPYLRHRVNLGDKFPTLCFTAPHSPAQAL